MWRISLSQINVTDSTLGDFGFDVNRRFLPLRADIWASVASHGRLSFRVTARWEESDAELRKTEAGASSILPNAFRGFGGRDLWVCSIQVRFVEIPTFCRLGIDWLTGIRHTALPTGNSDMPGSFLLRNKIFKNFDVVFTPRIHSFHSFSSDVSLHGLFRKSLSGWFPRVQRFVERSVGLSFCSFSSELQVSSDQFPILSWRLDTQLIQGGINPQEYELNKWLIQ